MKTEPQASPRVIWLFAAAILASASLLFTVQPMVAKMILPEMGGAAQVWALCMVFFQSVLLLGYLYAWAMQRWLALGRQLMVHAVVAAGAFVFLPLQLRRMPGLEQSELPMPWLLGALVLTVGMPFFVTSTTSPLLQAWFARTSHEQASDPYPLYAASNLGSMIALLAYSLLLEPMATLRTNTWVWAAGYALFFVLMLGCAWFLRGHGGARVAQTEEAPEPERVSKRGDSARWVLYGAIPSSMLLGVTQYMSTDVASVPLIWLAPLAIYLLSFIVVFARTKLVAPHVWSLITYALAPSLLLLAIFSNLEPIFSFGVCLLGLFISSNAFLGRMVELRPAANRLTSFYVLMSLGGVLGGLFNAILAPLVFSGFYEFAIACMVIVLALPHEHMKRVEALSLPVKLLYAAGITLSVFAPLWMIYGELVTFDVADFVLAGAILALPLIMVRAVPLGKILLVAAATLLLMDVASGEGQLYRERDFYGVVRVMQEDGVHVMVHGNTVHGAQTVGSRTPMSYHWPEGPAGDVFEHMLAPSARVAVVGVGVGALCGYYRPGDAYELYDINPRVIEVAQDTSLFTYLSTCGEPQLFVGDGRIEIEKRPDASFDLLVIDAFNSDSIPTHLLTREAVGIYARKLKPGGVLLLHISNRYLDLEGVVERVGEANGMEGMLGPVRQEDAGGLEGEVSIWAVLTRSQDVRERLGREHEWTPLRQKSAPLWTDTHTSIVPLLWEGMSKGVSTKKPAGARR